MIVQLLKHRLRPAGAPRWLKTLRNFSGASSAGPDKLYKGNRVIGIVREVYNKWERRAPFCPEHVAELVNQGYRVLVQPSDRRIYPNNDYTQAGAVVTEDLTEASVVLGVKQVPIEMLLPDKTYMFFSHTIKAQPENMALLDALMAKRIRFIDYECITSSGVRTGKRLVAFGRYAGMAGFVDILQGVGQHLLSRGFSTPFLNSPSTFMYHDLESAKEGLRQLGQHIREQGLAPEVSPIVFAFTGTGNVAKGAQEMFELLPHEWVDCRVLGPMVAKLQARGEACHKVYGTVVTEDCLVERIQGGQGGFDKHEYRTHPERYRSIFHDRVAPHISVLVNGIYWDHRYPRLLTNSQVRELALSGHSRLFAVSDVSCDVEGSLEFLCHSTQIEKPYFTYLPTDGTTVDGVDARGIVVCGVDILPSELPREASQSFGDALMPLLPHLASSEGYAVGSPLEALNADLPPPLQGAVITVNGQLPRGYEYISFLRQQREREKLLHDKVHGGSKGRGGPASDLPLMTMTLHGHLFDSGLINQVLDLIEARGGSFHITECIVRPNRGLVKNTSTVVLVVEAQSRGVLQDISSKVRTLVSLLEAAEATVSEVHQEEGSGEAHRGPAGGAAVTTSPAKVTSHPTQTRVLVLGAGRVAGPAIEYLGRDPSRQLTIVGAGEKEACVAARRAKWTKAVALDVTAPQMQSGLDKLVSQAHVVVSLLPAGLHASVAKLCLPHRVHLVTSSYVSDDMRALDAEARARGVALLNEAGLDPGMDHLSAMRIIDDAKARGGHISSFRSVCGGLPAPEAADNPFLYKFSWSPRAVLSAAQQTATYKLNGVEVTVDQQHLLQSAMPIDAWGTLRLEVLPNRNSLKYGELYGIPDASTIFRGTLRYQGWSQVMHGCRALGLFHPTPLPQPGLSWRRLLAQELGVDPSSLGPEEASGPLERAMLQRLCLHQGEREARKVVAALRWLGALSEHTPTQGPTHVDAFVSLLEERLRYHEDERDMVLMRHDIEVGGLEQGRVRERHVASLLAYGTQQDSAMARTVGLTCAMAAELLLQGRTPDGTTTHRGVLTPLTRDIYDPLLKKLADEGLSFKEEKTVTLAEGAAPDGRAQHACL